MEFLKVLGSLYLKKKPGMESFWCWIANYRLVRPMPILCLWVALMSAPSAFVWYSLVIKKKKVTETLQWFTQFKSYQVMEPFCPQNFVSLGANDVYSILNLLMFNFKYRQSWLLFQLAICTLSVCLYYDSMLMRSLRALVTPR